MHRWSSAYLLPVGGQPVERVEEHEQHAVLRGKLSVARGEPLVGLVTMTDERVDGLSPGVLYRGIGFPTASPDGVGDVPAPAARDALFRLASGSTARKNARDGSTTIAS